MDNRTDDERFVTMTISLTRAQKEAIRAIARRRQSNDSAVVRDAIRPYLEAEASSVHGERQLATAAS